MVYWLYHFGYYGDIHCVLLLDYCSARKVDKVRLPHAHPIIFLPPNVTNIHQPVEMRMITSLKVGYKMKMLGGLLDIFDTEGGVQVD